MKTIIIISIFLVCSFVAEAQTTILSFDLEDYTKRIDFVTNHQAQSYYGSCGRCGIQWRYANGHTVQYSERRGLFAICEYCWDECSQNERIFYYQKLWFEQEREYGKRKEGSWGLLKENIIKESDND